MTRSPCPPPHPKLPHQGLPPGNPWQVSCSERDIGHESLRPGPPAPSPRARVGSYRQAGQHRPGRPCATTRSPARGRLFSPPPSRLGGDLPGLKAKQVGRARQGAPGPQARPGLPQRTPPGAHRLPLGLGAALGRSPGPQKEEPRPARRARGTAPDGRCAGRGLGVPPNLAAGPRRP